MFKVALDPYEVVVPYSTCESEASLVVQLMVAPVDVMFVDETALMTGGVVSAGVGVVKVKSLETCKFPV